MNDNPETLVRFPEALKITGERRSTAYAKIKARTFPQPVKLGPNSVAFVLQELLAYNRQKIDERDSRLAEKAVPGHGKSA